MAVTHNVLSHVGVTIHGVLDWGLDLLTTYTHDLQLEAIKAPLLISTIRESPQHPLSLFQPAMSSPAIPWQRLLTTEILHFHALWSFLHSLWCRIQLWTQSQSHIATDGQSVMGLMTRYLLLFDSYGLVFVGRPLWREDGSLFCICCWPLPAQSFLGPSPLGLATIFYCLRFETSLSITSYDSQGHGGGIRPRLHTG
jgi:hypothetical protein